MRILRALGATLVLSLALVPIAHAACGDGIKQAGEACDASATGGDTACPDACVTPPLIGQCTCAVPSGDARSYTILGASQVRIGGGATVVGGNVGVLDPNGYLVVSKGGTLPASGQAVGDKSKIVPGSSVGRLFSNEVTLKDPSVVLAGGPYPFDPPLELDNLPTLPGFSAGSVDIIVNENDTVHLEPGSYGRLTVGQGGRLVLRGYTSGSGVGRYNVVSIKLAFDARLEADNPVVINVRDRIGTTGQSYLGPAPGEPLQAGDVQVNVAGGAARISRGATLSAHLRAPDGKIGVGAGANVTGRLLGSKVTVAKRASIISQGSCGDGIKSPVEECDASAPNGSAACPGDCIPGDPQGLGRIELGQRGQCRCRCESNADCNDGNACDGVETCQSGVCVPGLPPDCDDGNACTEDCRPQQGCVSIPVQDGRGCSDDDLCTRNDFCEGGVCKSGEARDCNDNNSCTDDTCVPATGCVREPLADATTCNDGNACTQGDACIRGACVGGPPPSCVDQNPCTVGSCDAVEGCKQTDVANGTNCAGPSPCTVQDSCQEGVCTSGVSTLCNDGNPCTADACLVIGAPGEQTAQCQSTQLPDFTPCGPNGLVCFFGACR